MSDAEKPRELFAVKRTEDSKSYQYFSKIEHANAIAPERGNFEVIAYIEKSAYDALVKERDAWKFRAHELAQHVRNNTEVIHVLKERDALAAQLAEAKSERLDFALARGRIERLEQELAEVKASHQDTLALLKKNGEECYVHAKQLAEAKANEVKDLAFAEEMRQKAVQRGYQIERLEKALTKAKEILHYYKKAGRLTDSPAALALIEIERLERGE